MNKPTIPNSISVLLIAMTTILTNSCVNEEYDLSKGIDMDMTLLQNTTIPLGNVASISVNSLLGDTNIETGPGTTSLFTADDNGNLTLSFGFDKISQTFKMPEVSLGKSGINADVDVAFNISSQYAGLPGSLFSGDKDLKISYKDANKGRDLNANMTLRLDQELPKQVLDIEYVELDAKIDFQVKASEGSILHLAKGFKISFPQFMKVKKANESVDYYHIGGEDGNENEIIFDSDIRISDEPLVLSLLLYRMDSVSSFIEEKENASNELRRYIIHDDNVTASGDFYLMPADYIDSYIPAKPELTFHVSLTDLVMTSASIKIDMDMSISDEKIEITDLPEMFEGEGTMVDLYNPIVRFTINNESPLEININAGISSYSGSHTTDIHIGDYNGDDRTEPVTVSGGQQVDYYFSRRGYHESKDGMDIGIEKLGEIINELPDSIRIHDINVESERKFITIEANKEYTVELEYEFFSPLAFGKELHISMGYDIDLGLEGNLGLDKLIIGMNMLNTVPLDFNIVGTAVDNDGNEIMGTTVDMNLDLEAGTLEKPVESPVTLTISSTNTEVSISKLRLNFTAESSEHVEGEVLNTAQGLDINDLYVTLPHGITMNLTDTEDNDD